MPKRPRPPPGFIPCYDPRRAELGLPKRESNCRYPCCIKGGGSSGSDSDDDFPPTAELQRAQESGGSSSASASAALPRFSIVPNPHGHTALLNPKQGHTNLLTALGRTYPLHHPKDEMHDFVATFRPRKLHYAQRYLRRGGIECHVVRAYGCPPGRHQLQVQPALSRPRG